jgi:hypothetical protein
VRRSEEVRLVYTHVLDGRQPVVVVGIPEEGFETFRRDDDDLSFPRRRGEERFVIRPVVSSSSPESQHCQLSYVLISQAADHEKTLAILGPTRATITEPNKMCLPSSLT